MEVSLIDVELHLFARGSSAKSMTSSVTQGRVRFLVTVDAREGEEEAGV
jgi:hypothetical protein